MKEFVTKLVWIWRILRSRSYIIITDEVADMRINVKSPFLLDDKEMLEEQRDILRFYQKSLKLVADRWEAEIKTYGEGGRSPKKI